MASLKTVLLCCNHFCENRLIFSYAVPKWCGVARFFTRNNAQGHSRNLSGISALKKRVCEVCIGTLQSAGNQQSGSNQPVGSGAQDGGYGVLSSILVTLYAWFDSECHRAVLVDVPSRLAATTAITALSYWPQ
jgi:hypothetical protein